MEEYKIWIAIRSDLNMPSGKMAVQAGHAVQLLCVKVLQNDRQLYDKYTIGQAIPKIAVTAEDEQHLLQIKKTADQANIPNVIIRDSGRTVFNQPTYTVCAFGPALRSELPGRLRRLQLYKD